MNSQADKLIRERLSSIDSLPDGYTPNIDSKWMIIHESKRRGVGNYKLWIGIAACFLLFLTSAIIWKQDPASTIVETPLQNQLQHIEDVATNRVMKVATENPQEIAKTPFTASLKRKANINSGVTLHPEEKVINAPIVNEEEVAPEVALEMSIPSAKRMQRYVEIDFNEPVQQTQTIAEESSPPVKFKLGFRNEIVSKNSSVSTKPLRIRQNF